MTEVLLFQHALGRTPAIGEFSDGRRGGVPVQICVMTGDEFLGGDSA